MAHFELDARQRFQVGRVRRLVLQVLLQPALQPAHVCLDADEGRAQFVRHAAQAGRQPGQFLLRAHVAAHLDDGQHGNREPVHGQLLQDVAAEQKGGITKHGKRQAGQQGAAQVGQHGDARIEVKQHDQRHQQ